MPTVPMLHLHGARDGCLSARFATRLAEVAPPTCRVEVVPSAGHFLQLERPDRVNALVRGFLTKVS